MFNLPWAKDSKEKSKKNNIVQKQKFEKWLKLEINSHIKKSEKSGFNYVWVYYQYYYDKIFPEVIYSIKDELERHGYIVEINELLQAFKISWEK